MKQDHGQATRSFLASIKGKALTCAYQKKCSSQTCATVIDFTDVLVKDILIAGLVDEDIEKDALGRAKVDIKTVEETISYIEAKEMAQDALMNSTLSNSSISSYKAEKKKTPTEPKKERTRCSECSVEMDKRVWNQRQGRHIEVSMCLSCWKKANSKSKKNKQKEPKTNDATDETSALLIGG